MKSAIELNGQLYRLVPNFRLVPATEKEWHINFIHENGCQILDGVPLLLIGHNGHSLPANHSIWEVRLGDDKFSVGDVTTDGKIERFLHMRNEIVNGSYVFAVVNDENNFENLVEIDYLKHKS